MRKRVLRSRKGSKKRKGAGVSAPKVSRTMDSKEDPGLKMIDTSGTLPGTVEKEFTYGRGDKKQKFYIAVDEKTGKIPPEILALRLMQEGDGSRRGTKRNATIDVEEHARKKFKMDDDPEKLVSWWAYPNESDIDGIDTPGSPFFSEAQKVKGKKAKMAQKGIAVFGGTKEQREKIREYIEKGFTVSEQKKLRGVLIEISPLEPGVAGAYYGKVKGGYHLVRIDPKSVNADTVVHELVHHLRVVDQDRKSPLLRQRPYEGKDKDLEEAATTAESITRHKPYAWESVGYYHLIEDGRKKSHLDRGLFTNQEVRVDPDGQIRIESNRHLIEKALRGKRALKSVDKNFVRSNIGHLNLTGGKLEAVDQYYTVMKKNGQTENIHVYSPKGKRVIPEVRKGEKLYEWRDGEKVRIK